MVDLSEQVGMLFTLGNVMVCPKTEYAFPNPFPDPITARRSQE